MPEFRGVNTDLNFELLNGVYGRKDDVAVEIRVGVVDAVEGVVVEHDALPACGYGLLRAVATLPVIGLRRVRGEGGCVWRGRGQTQIFAAVQGQFRDDLVLYHCADGCSLGLQQVRGGRNFDCLANLAQLQNHVETHDLLYLDFEWFADCRLETRKFRSQPVKARRDGWKGVATRLRSFRVADGVGIDIGQRNGGSRYHRTRRISHPPSNFTKRLTIQAAGRDARQNHDRH